MQNRLYGVLTCWIVLASFATRCQAEGLTSEVRQFKGIPALYVNGVLTSQTLAAPYRDPPQWPGRFQRFSPRRHFDFRYLRAVSVDGAGNLRFCRRRSQTRCVSGGRCESVVLAANSLNAGALVSRAVSR